MFLFLPLEFRANMSPTTIPYLYATSSKSVKGETYLNQSDHMCSIPNERPKKQTVKWVHPTNGWELFVGGSLEHPIKTSFSLVQVFATIKVMKPYLRMKQPPWNTSIYQYKLPRPTWIPRKMLWQLKSKHISGVILYVTPNPYHNF